MRTAAAGLALVEALRLAGVPAAIPSNGGIMTQRRRLQFVVEGYEPMRYWRLIERAIGRDLADEIVRMAECGR